MNLNTFKITGIAAATAELIIEEKHEINLGTEHQTVLVISALKMRPAHTSTDALKQTSHVHNRSHEGACHCMIHMSDLKTLKITGIPAPIKELIIEHQH